MSAGFYVTACREELRAGDRPTVNQRVAWLAGPFADHAAAIAAVPACRDICEGITAGESHWWHFGTARREGDTLPVGKLNGQLAESDAWVEYECDGLLHAAGVEA